MSDTSAEILDPDQPFTLSTGTQVTVRELTWKQTKGFLTSLANKASEFITFDAAYKADINVNRLMGIVVTDLGESLVMATTGMDQDTVDNLSARDMLACLNRAVALNLRPEMIEAGKAVAGQIMSLVPKPDPQRSAKPTIS